MISVSNSESSEESESESHISDVGGDNTKAESGMSDNDASWTDKESDDDEDDVIIKNESWADSVAKILGSSKPKHKKTLVLSRAKKLADVIKKEKDEKPSFEVVGEQAEVVQSEVKKESAPVSEPPVKKKVK